MKAIQRLVVVTLLGVWCFPATSLANPLPTPGGAVAPGATSGAAPAKPSTEDEAASLGAREKQSQDLQDFKGGGLYIYLGGGAALLLLLILLIVLL